MKAKFIEGSIFKHICAMTFASTAGLLSLFFVDLMDMYWLSLLGEVELAAAIGFAGSILFFTLSLSIGLSIGCSALVSQSIGQGDREQTRALVGNILSTIVIVLIPVAALVILMLDPLLDWLGANGRAMVLAQDYIRIILPSMPILGLAMAASGILRALGNAKEAMYLTLLGGIVNAVLDPILIFGLSWNIEGAAVATVISRLAMLAYGIRLVVFKHQLLSFRGGARFVADVRAYFTTALPAVFTNLSTPIGVAYTTAIMAQFGDSAVAGTAIIGKLQPLAFAGLFALSGSVGPIVGQNLGAKRYERIMETLNKSILFVLVYCLAACFILLVSKEFLVSSFSAEGDAALLIRWFCWGLSSMFVFGGLIFCTNAMFNNLKVAHWATAINFAKATVFTIPFVYYGAQWGGPIGIFIGGYIGTVIVAVISVWLAYQKIRSFQPRP